MGEREFTEHLIRRGDARSRFIRDLSYWANVFEKDPEPDVLQYVGAIESYLAEQDIPKEVLEPLAALRDALLDVEHGLHSPLFKPSEKKGDRLPHAYARKMGEAALAVSIAPRNLRNSILKQAAKKLKVSERKLENFRRNLFASDDRIKSIAAKVPLWFYMAEIMEPEMVSFEGLVPSSQYQEYLDWLQKNLPRDSDYAEAVLARLKPVPKKYQDV